MNDSNNKHNNTYLRKKQQHNHKTGAKVKHSIDTNEKHSKIQMKCKQVFPWADYNKNTCKVKY